MAIAIAVAIAIVIAAAIVIAIAIAIAIPLKGLLVAVSDPEAVPEVYPRRVTVYGFVGPPVGSASSHRYL